MARTHTNDIDKLIQMLSRVPGLGPRSARRAVLALLQKKEPLMRPLIAALEVVADSVDECETCGNLDTLSPCSVCSDTRRDASIICVVEDVADLWAMDRAQTFKGHYHVLGGTLSALDGVGPDELNIAGLMRRLDDGVVKEVILGLSATIDGQTTSHFLASHISARDIKVTALAHGLPVGGELDYLDDGTLVAALNARRPVEQ